MLAILLVSLIITGYVALWFFFGRHDNNSAESENTIHLVIAGNFEQFRYWVDENFGPGYHENIKYVREYHDMLGYRGEQVRIHYVGTYAERKDLAKLQAEANAHNLAVAV